MPLAAFYAVLEIGGHEAARRASLDYDFILILIALVLFFLAVAQGLAAGARRLRVGATSGEPAASPEAES